MESSRPEKCSNCKKPASIHLTQVVDGCVTKVSLCSECPFAEAAKAGSSVDLVAQAAPDKKAVVARFADAGRCPNCGLASKDFKESGRLGCSDCYKAFEKNLEPLIVRLHQGNEHVGKRPKRCQGVVSESALRELREKMQRHVELEEFEQAAELRDQIQALEESLG